MPAKLVWTVGKSRHGLETADEVMGKGDVLRRPGDRQ